MRFFTIIIILVLALLMVYFFAPAKFAEGKAWINEKISGIKKTTTPQTNTNTDIEYEENETQNNLSTNHSQPVIIKNACGYTKYGKPNYDGTTKEGKGCDIAYQPDLTCIANPPKNYDGTIDRINQISVPAMTCCLEDGTCQWSE